jgi:antitoxin YobK
MSMQNYETACKLIEHAGNGDFEGAKTESLVTKAESVLGVKFPPTYRRFLLEFGCGYIDPYEVYGLVDDNFEKSGIPDGIWLTLTKRKSIKLKPSYVIIGDVGDGTQYAINTGRVNAQGECPVVLLTVDGIEIEIVANSFGSFLLGAIQGKV